MNELLSTLGAQLAPVLIDLVLALVALATAQLVAYIRNKSKNEVALYGARVIERLESSAKKAVRTSAFSMRLEEALADGKLTAEEIEILKAAALEDARAHLGPAGLKQLKTIVDPDDLTQTIRMAVENQLASRSNLKN